MTDDGKAKVNVNVDEMAKVLKTYKKLKKYMKSNLYEIRNLNGTDAVSYTHLRAHET